MDGKEKDNVTSPFVIRSLSYW